MTNKQALRKKFEQWWEINYHNGNPPRFGWEHWRDGDGYQIDDDESELDGMWEAWQAAHSSKLEAADKRIAELEANNDSAHKALLNARHRTVTMPTGYSLRPGHPIKETERSVMIPKDGGQWLSRFDVEHALRVAGIRINGED